jgi:hypothetical protein
VNSIQSLYHLVLKPTIKSSMGLKGFGLFGRVMEGLRASPAALGILFNEKVQLFILLLFNYQLQHIFYFISYLF